LTLVCPAHTRRSCCGVQHETSAVGHSLDAEEHAEEPVGQILVATDGATVEAPERGEDKAAGIELDDGW
jgi:hypothetical protein